MVRDCGLGALKEGVDPDKFEAASSSPVDRDRAMYAHKLTALEYGETLADLEIRATVGIVLVGCYGLSVRG